MKKRRALKSDNAKKTTLSLTMPTWLFEKLDLICRAELISRWDFIGDVVEKKILDYEAKNKPDTKKFQEVGWWYKDNTIKLVKIDGIVYALNGFDGNVYADCWVCEGDFFNLIGEKNITIKPIMENGDVLRYSIK